MTDAIHSGNFTSIDTETTGLNCSSCEVIEIGAVRFRNWVPVKELDILIKPKNRIPYFITNLTGISNEMVKDQPCFCEIIDQFLDFVGEDDIVGHNLSFDLKFLSTGGIPVYTSGFEFHDTMKLARKNIKRGVDIENHKLGTLCDYYGIELRHAHRACDDAAATGILFKKICKNFY